MKLCLLLCISGALAMVFHGGAQSAWAAQQRTPTATVTPSPSIVPTAQSLSVTVAVSGGTGNPIPTGSVILTSGSYSSAGTALSGGEATFEIPAGTLAVGTDTLTANYTPDATSSATYTATSATGAVLVFAASWPHFWGSALSSSTIIGVFGNSSVSAANNFFDELANFGQSGQVLDGMTVLPIVHDPATNWIVNTGNIWNMGYNGISLSGWIATGQVALLCSEDPNWFTPSEKVGPFDLLVIRGPLINDVRTGATTLAQGKALIGQELSILNDGCPTTDILLTSENSMLTTDPDNYGWVTMVPGKETLVDGAAGGITSLGSHVITVAAMPTSLHVGGQVVVDTGATEETVTVTAMSNYPAIAGADQTFTATFLKPHAQSFTFVATLASAAQAYSDILRLSVTPYAQAYPNVVVADTQALLYGVTSQATSPLMLNQLHEGYLSNGLVGTKQEADLVAGIIAALSMTPTVIVNPSSSSITTAQPLTVNVGVIVNGGTPTGSVALSSGSYTSTATSLKSGSASINIPAGSLATGNDTLTVTYTPDTNSSSTYYSASGTASVTVTTVPQTPPFGNFEGATDTSTGSTTVSQADMLRIGGWVADVTDGAPLANVKVYIDGTAVGTPTLGIARPDVAAALNNAAYLDSGYLLFYSAATLSARTHAVTVVAIDSGGQSTTFGPLTITVTSAPPPPPPPFGNFEGAIDSSTGSATVSQTDMLRIGGWVADVTDGAPLANVKVYIDGTAVGTPTLGIARPDVAAALNNAAYLDSGYLLFYSAATLSVGTHAVTVVAIDSGGRSTTFGPLTIAVTSAPPLPPFGNFEGATDSSTGSATVSQTDMLRIGGWVADVTDGAPLANVKVYIDGTAVGTPTLGIARPDVAAALNNAAYLDSGYLLFYSAAKISVGSHAVTAVAIDSGGRSTTFGPLTIAVTSAPPPPPPPFGNFEGATDSSTGSTTVSRADMMRIGGWVADVTDGAPLANVKVYIDGTAVGTPTLGIARPDVAAALSNAAYLDSGYLLFCSAATLSVGTHAVTAVAIDSGGRSTTFGPLTIAVVP
jgi:protocatechuate 3,4-dioxygenase beta subunit